MMIEVQCLKCLKPFKTYPSKIKHGRGRYCSRACSQSVFASLGRIYGEKTRFRAGQKPFNAKGWRLHQSRKGVDKFYVEIHLPQHPRATKSGYVRLHRVLMEEKIGRYLNKDEIVHHIDGNTLNNDINNLELMSGEEHRRHHLRDNIHKRWIERRLPYGITESLEAVA